MRPLEPKMFSLLSSANRTLFQYVSGVFFIDFMNESLRDVFFVLTKNFLLVERPFNRAALRTHRKVSRDIEIENF